jgi:hypothetical protein
MIVDKYYSLGTNPIIFTNGSIFFQIAYPNANKVFSQGDKITIQGFQFYEVRYKSVNLLFKNNSNDVILDITPNYTQAIPYYNVALEISRVTNNGLSYYKNIPLTMINQLQQVYLYSDNSKEYRFAFKIPIQFYTDNESDYTLISDCTIKYYYVGNYPINYINAGYPTSLYNLQGYQIISSVDNQYITIKLTNEISINNNINIQGTWNNQVFSTGGDNIQIGLITNISRGNPTPSNYTVQLDKRIDNVACIQIKSSEIPNTQKVFYNLN